MSIFSSVPITKLSRSTFNLDHENKMSFNFGGIYPLMCQTILPGDKISLGLQSFVRTMPLVSPVMHRNDIKVDAFFVPWRLIWPNYEAWLQCTDTSIRFPKLYVNHGTEEGIYNRILGVGSLADYLGFASVPWAHFPSEGGQGIPSGAHATQNRKVCLLPFRAYQIIYDYYFRNKTLEPSLFDEDSGIEFDNSDEILTDETASKILKYYQIRQRSWRRDPFTSALPNPQKGNPILMPTGKIVQDGHLTLDDSSTDDKFKEGQVYGYDSDSASTSYGQALKSVKVDFDLDVYNEKHYDYKSGLKIDPTTLEDLRYAEVLEEYDEALARSAAGQKGAFKEWLLSIWRTLSPDARLDRPEYLGGYRGPISISEVLQTSATDASSPQGNMAGKGLSVGGNRLFGNHYFKEPGYLMVTMSIVPKSSYCDGDPRQFLYESPFDFPNPYFANLGEQEVFTQEISADLAINYASQQKTFGYNVRNYEMKQIPDTFHGQMRSSLRFWHEGRHFGSDFPVITEQDVVNLNENFIKMYPEEVNRIFAVDSGDKLIGEFFFSMKAKRSLPYYGVPRFGHTR